MKTASRIFYVLLTGLTLCSCSTANKDVVLARADDMSSRPDWVKETETFTVENGTVYMLGSHTMPATGRLEAGYRIAENNAKAGISGAIEQRLNFIFQNAEEGTGLDETQTRFIGAESSRLVASSIRPGKRYWEKVAMVIDADGNRDVQYRIFAQVTMPEADFKKAVQDAIRRNSGKKGLSADFAEKVNKHWDQFTAE